METWQPKGDDVDPYEANAWEKIKAHRYLISDALSRADDQLTEEACDREQWGYAYVQLSRAALELHALMKQILAVRSRRAALEGDPFKPPGA